MNRDLSYYLGLSYKVEIEPVPENLGGGYTAQIPELGKFSFVGDGDTPQEALLELERVKEDRFRYYLDNGLEIPEPRRDSSEYSGRFVVRIPKDLHRELTEAAQINNSSLNQFVNYLLSSRLSLKGQDNKHNELLKRMDLLCNAVWDINYSFSLQMPKEKTHTPKIRHADFLKAA